MSDEHCKEFTLDAASQFQGLVEMQNPGAIALLISILEGRIVLFVAQDGSNILFPTTEDIRNVCQSMTLAADRIDAGFFDAELKAQGAKPS